MKGKRGVRGAGMQVRETLAAAALAAVAGAAVGLAAFAVAAVGLAACVAPRPGGGADPGHPTPASAQAAVEGTGAGGTHPMASPDLTVRDMHGDAVDPLRGHPGRAVVLVFLTTDCPIANGYAPEIQALMQRFHGRPVAFHLVHVDAAVTAGRARAHAAEYGYHGSILLDPDHRLVARCGATVTPEAVLYDAAGALRYRGRIDDRYGAIGRKRFAVSHHDLRDAIDAVLEGRPVATPRTEAVGCTIESSR